MYDLAESILKIIVVFLLLKWAIKSAFNDIKESSMGTIQLIKMVNKNGKKDFIEAKNKICNLYKLYKTKKIQDKNRK